MVLIALIVVAFGLILFFGLKGAAKEADNSPELLALQEEVEFVEAELDIEEAKAEMARVEQRQASEPMDLQSFLMRTQHLDHSVTISIITHSQDGKGVFTTEVESVDIQVEDSAIFLTPSVKLREV